MTLNALIGAPYLAALPVLALWTALSLHVWLTSGRELSRTNYRLAVTNNLFAWTLLVADLARLRFAVRLGPLAPEPVSLVVLAVRAYWWLSLCWATLALYGHLSGKLWRRLRAVRTSPDPPRSGPDPYLLDRDAARELASLRVRTARSRSRLSAVAADLSAIVERIERDTPILLAEDAATTRGSRRWIRERDARSN